MTLITVGITLNLIDGAGNPVTTGSAVFTPTGPVATADGLSEILAAPVSADLSSGSFPVTATVLATDRTSAPASSWGWQVAFQGVPGGYQPFTFQAPAGPVSFTGAAGTPGVATWTATSAVTRLPNGTAVTVAGGSLPAGLAAGAYYVVSSSGQTLNLAATPGGTPVAFTGSGSGTLTVTAYYLSSLAPVTSLPQFSPYQVRPSVRTVSSAYTAQDGDVVLAGASGGAFTVTSPASVKGALVRVKKTDSSSNAVTFAPASGQVDGASTVQLTTQYAHALYMSDGVNWWAV